MNGKRWACNIEALELQRHSRSIWSSGLLLLQVSFSLSSTTLNRTLTILISYNLVPVSTVIVNYIDKKRNIREDSKLVAELQAWSGTTLCEIPCYKTPSWVSIFLTSCVPFQLQLSLASSCSFPLQQQQFLFQLVAGNHEARRRLCDVLGSHRGIRDGRRRGHRSI